MIFPAVCFGILTDKVALAHETVDLIRGVRLGDVQEIGKLPDGRRSQKINDLQRAGLHGGQRTVPFTDRLKNLAEKLELELIKDGNKVFFHHSSYFLFLKIFDGTASLFYSVNSHL